MVCQTTCSICTEFFILAADEIAALPCGHVFHHKCITEWFKSKVNCPECRKPFKRNSLIPKLFFNVEENEQCNTDPGSLKNELDSLKLQLRVKDNEKSELTKVNASLLEKISHLKDNIDALQISYKEERNTNHTLAKELKFHKKLQSEAEDAKAEMVRLSRKLADLRSVDDVVRGNQDDIEVKINTSDKAQLATITVILQKELEAKRKEVKSLRQETLDLKKQFNLKRKQLQEKNSVLEKTMESLQLAEKDTRDLEAKNSRLKEKIGSLEQALGSPSDPAVSFAHRLIHESPAPHKKPKLSFGRDAMDTSGENLFASPEVTRDSKKLPSLDKDVDLPVTVLKISSQSSSAKSREVKEIGNVPVVSGLSNFNLFKKPSGSGLMSSRIKTGYNGLGGHERHVETGAPFKKVTGVKKRNVFGKAKIAGSGSTDKPPLPTLDNFLG